jgi:hypothetical protein
MNNSEENILNTKCNWKHCALEAEIKRIDPNQDKTRPALLKRFLDAADKKTDWMSLYYLLGDVKHDVDVPQFNSWQAKYDAETGEKLNAVRQSMEKSLKEGGVITKLLQTQYMLQLLMINYREALKKDILSIKADRQVDEEIGLPEMSAIFTEMMLSDKNCEALQEIRRILVEWRNA